MLTSLFFAIILPEPKPVLTPKWKLTFAQEFDGPKGQAPDSKVWSRDIGGGGFGNGEWESYTDGNKNAFLDGKGNLIIEARKEPTTGPDNIKRDYSSARLKTIGTFAQAYGKFEARIKMPVGKGIWPAFWMLGDNIEKAGWPNSGEIDITEYLGHETLKTHGTVHGPGYNGAGGISGSMDSKTPLNNDFHIYGIEWEPEQIRWYLDGVLYHTVTPNDIGTNDWVFDHPHFFILNLAVGGGWPGYPDETTVFPQQMVIDYVRAYTDENLVVDKEGIKKRDAFRKANGPKYTWPGPFKIPGTVTAADFNVGGEGKAYHDTDGKNEGGQYRTKEGVDIGASGASGNRYSIGWTKAGEWLNYDLDVAEAGNYRLEIKAASDGDGGSMHLEIDGEPVGGKIYIPNTGGWTTWKSTYGGIVNLPKGRHTLRVVMDSNSEKTGSIGNLLSFVFEKA